MSLIGGIGSIGSTEFVNGRACTDSDGDCDESAVSNCHGTSDVTNQTACVDGFVNGWRQFCMSNLRLCGIETLEGIFPGHMEDGKSMSVCYRTWDGGGSDDANGLVLALHVSTDTTGSACPPIKGTPSS